MSRNRRANRAQLSEALSPWDDGWLDPREAWCDDGERWLPVGVDRGHHAVPFWTQSEHDEIRRECRWLAVSNEFAINGHENRISYIVGTGHRYRVTARQGDSLADDVVAAAQDVLEEFIESNDWHRRQSEIVLRRDRDGEVFLRFFRASGGRLVVRFVEPGQVATPTDSSHDPASSFGVCCQPHDVEDVLAYWIDGEQVSAHDIQHRKANVDANVKRGLPLYYPVRKNLRRAERLLRNMSQVAEIQSAIALIRRHERGTRGAIEAFVTSKTEAQPSRRGQTSRRQRFAPGSILDVPASVDYDFPAAGLNAAAYVQVLQAELRAIASRLVMPEFMLTSDASNAAYASTMVAEGPAVRNFERLQAQQSCDDRLVLQKALVYAAEAGRLPQGVAQRVRIAVVPPSLAVRDQLSDVQAAQIEHSSGILSPQTWCQRRGLDYDQEQANWRQHEVAVGAKRAAPGQ